jgi:hypothetical protein
VESNAPEIAVSSAPLPSEMPQDIRQSISKKATPGLSSEHGEHGSLQHPNVPVNRFCWFWLTKERGRVSERSEARESDTITDEIWQKTENNGVCKHLETLNFCGEIVSVL